MYPPLRLPCISPRSSAINNSLNLINIYIYGIFKARKLAKSQQSDENNENLVINTAEKPHCVLTKSDT